MQHGMTANGGNACDTALRVGKQISRASRNDIHPGENRISEFGISHKDGFKIRVGAENLIAFSTR